VNDSITSPHNCSTRVQGSGELCVLIGGCESKFKSMEVHFENVPSSGSLPPLSKCSLCSHTSS
jgi:hypothetical protein